ncbi:MAG TPA: hypothetical protein VF268_08350, partial [Gammaproteobacteria bacterium]
LARIPLLAIGMVVPVPGVRPPHVGAKKIKNCSSNNCELGFDLGIFMFPYPLYSFFAPSRLCVRQSFFVERVVKL